MVSHYWRFVAHLMQHKSAQRLQIFWCDAEIQYDISWIKFQLRRTQKGSDGCARHMVNEPFLSYNDIIEAL